MLNVRVRFVAYELAEGQINGIYQVPVNATVRELLTICQAQSKTTIPAENIRLMLFILNGKPAVIDTPITKDSTLHVCRVIVGG